MNFNASWDVPSTPGTPGTHLSLEAGQVLVMVGPNGSGKSALSHWLSVQPSSAPVRRVLAHRRVWMPSAGPEMTASARISMDSNFAHFDALASSRVKDDLEAQRSSRLLFDLLGKVNGRNARVAELLDTGGDPSSVEPSVLTSISEIFAAAGLRLAFRLTDNLSFEAVRESTPYPISDMSDGEKGAFILAAEVLLAPQDSIQLIDEPERHLHRAISTRFNSALIEARKDCAFVLFTHDLDLVGHLDDSTTDVYMVASVVWSNAAATGWDLRNISNDVPMTEAARRAVLGGRDNLLFVEGATESLDLPLYTLLFSSWTVVPTGGSDEVLRTVTGLTSSDRFHWVAARGVVDGDAREQEEINALGSRGILVLPVNEVESLYYLPWIVEALAEQQATALDRDAEQLMVAATDAALTSLAAQHVKDNLAAVNALKVVRRKALASLPPKSQLPAAGSTVRMLVESPWSSERAVLDQAIRNHDLEGIVSRFSIRDCGYPTAIAGALGYKNRSDFEAAVRVKLRRDSTLLSRLTAFVGKVPKLV